MVVHCDGEVQISRVMDRDGSSRTEAQAAVKAQMPQEAKLKRADISIPNNGDLDELHRCVDCVVDGLVADSLSHPVRAWMGRATL
jgi:dephospho-CoA kinase